MAYGINHCRVHLEWKCLAFLVIHIDYAYLSTADVKKNRYHYCVKQLQIQIIQCASLLLYLQTIIPSCAAATMGKMIL